MRIILLIVIILTVLNASYVSAQAPQGISYQALARDSSGAILASQLISLRFTIHDSTSTGTILYQETFNPKTSTLGLFSVNLGTGTVVSGSFNGINWGYNAKFLQVEMDPLGGTRFTDMGTQQMMSVPYALYAGYGKHKNDTIVNHFFLDDSVYRTFKIGFPLYSVKGIVLDTNYEQVVGCKIHLKTLNLDIKTDIDGEFYGLSNLEDSISIQGPEGNVDLRIYTGSDKNLVQQFHLGNLLVFIKLEPYILAYNSSPNWFFNSANSSKKNSTDYFVFPPPQGYFIKEIDRHYFDRCKQLRDAHVKITKGFEAADYQDFSNFEVKNGLALVTCVESINEDGSRDLKNKCFDGSYTNLRWVDLFWARTGHFRVFVIVVTDLAFGPNTKPIREFDVVKWQTEGLSSFPNLDQPFTDEHRVYLLVYEFESNRPKEKIRALNSPRIPISQHIEKSKILNYLK